LIIGALFQDDPATFSGWTLDLDLFFHACMRYLFTNLPLAQSEADFLNLLPNRVNQPAIDTAGNGAVA
jgi:hypothetical protein